MGIKSSRKETEWQQSFQQKARWVQATADTGNVKVTVAGPYSRISIFGRPVKLPGRALDHPVIPAPHESSGRRPAANKSVGEKPRSAQENRRRNLKRQGAAIMHLINQNFDPRTAQFVTLTTKNNSMLFSEIKAECQKLFKRLRKTVRGIKYLAVPERGDNEGWHVHLIIDRELPLTKQVAAAFKKNGVVRSSKACWEVQWRIGFVHQKKIDGGGNLGASIAKYMSKNAGNPDLIGHHSVWRSDNLEPPAELSGQAAVRYVRQLAKGDAIPINAYSCSGIDFIDTLDVFDFCHDRKAALFDKAWWKHKQMVA